MNESYNIERIKLLAAGFVINDLDAKEEQEFRQLLAKYPQLIQEVDELQEILGKVLDEFTEVEVPSYLLPEIIKQAEATEQKKFINFKPKFIKITTVIGALLIVILGIDNYRLRYNFGIITAENNRLHQEMKQVEMVNSLLKETDTMLVTFQGNKKMKEASGMMLVNRKEEMALMSVKNLPTPPDGSFYLLWALVANDKLPCGEIKPYMLGNSLKEIPYSEEMTRDFYSPNFSGLFVTLETNPNASYPDGPIIMESSRI